MTSLSCPICDKPFTKRFSMKRHYARLHPNERIPEYLTPKIKDSIKCAICGSVFRNFSKLEYHLLSHNIALESEIITFENETEFYNWKKGIEEEEKVQYVQNTGRRVLTNNDVTVYYICHRSGSYKPIVPSSGRKRQLKTQGSSKINAFCSSRMKATFQTVGKVVVEYCWTHIGHENDSAHFNSPSEKKTYQNITHVKENEISTSENALDIDLGQCNSAELENLDSKNCSSIKTEQRKIRFRHDMSLKLKIDSVIDCSTDAQTAWSIEPIRGAQQCVVKSIKSECDCLLFCKYCKACIHKYSCTCPDASVKGNLCKHIHLVCRATNICDRNELPLECEVSPQVPNDEATNPEVNRTNSDNIDQNTVTLDVQESSDTKQLILEEFKSLLESVKSPHELKLLREGVRELKTFIETIEISQDPVIQVSKLDSSLNKKEQLIQFIII